MLSATRVHVLIHGYLRAEVPLYAIVNPVSKARWNQLANAANAQSSTHASSIQWESVPHDLQNDQTRLKDRIDQVHQQLGKQSDVVRQTLAHHAYFTRAGFDWHLWVAIKKLGCTSPEVFQMLADSAVPFRYGAFDHHNNLHLKTEWSKLCRSPMAHGRSTIYIDYWNGIGFKMALPTSLETTNDTELEDNAADYQRYDDRNTTPFAVRLGHLLRSRTCS